jgi:hypothetical protein
VRAWLLVPLALAAVPAFDAGAEEPPPLTWRIGAVHEHSGYSDGAIDTIPADYFAAAKTGANGMDLDFVFSSEHSDNADIPVTTNADCLTSPTNAITCAHLGDPMYTDKWARTLEQAAAATDDTFTGVRGFEWTNDIYNHMNVFFSTSYTNVKIDGSYLSMDVMWDWLQTPVADGGGADALVTFNHPGSNPKLSPFDGSLPHAELLAEHTTIDNWNEVAYVPEVDAQVVGMEINGGEDIDWYVRALTNGWHIGAVAAEDHHGTQWASPSMHKTLILTDGRAVEDYREAFAARRTVAVHSDLLGDGSTHPTIDFTLDGHVLGSRLETDAGTTHTISVATTGLPAGARVAIWNSEGEPIELGGASGSTEVTTDGDDWFFAVVSVDDGYSMVTAPIWLEPRG